MGLLAPGTFEPPDEATVNQMDAARAQLQREALDAATVVTTTASFVSVTAPVTKIINFFRDDKNQIDTEDTSSGAADGRVAMLQTLVNQLGDKDWFSVMAGEQSSSWWFSRAELLHRQLVDSVDTSSWSFSGMGSAYVADTSRQVAAKVVETAEKVKDVAMIGTPVLLLVIALVAVAVILVKVK